MYNVRVKRFFDTEQVQIFSKACHSKGEVKRPALHCDHETGEIKPRIQKGECMENPFNDGRKERLGHFDDSYVQDSLQKSCSRTVKCIYDIARSNKWEWFFTFTFNKEKIDRYNYDACCNAFHNWLCRIRKKCPDMIYLVVPEQHKDGAFHFHGLFANCMELDFKFSGRYDNKERAVYNIGDYNWGWTTATRITDFRRASSYLCKYITKNLCAVTRGKKRYWHSKNCALPVVEEYMIEMSEGKRLEEFLKDGHTYLKKIETPFSNVTYIERALSDR